MIGLAVAYCGIAVVLVGRWVFTAGSGPLSLSYLFGHLGSALVFALFASLCMLPTPGGR